MYILYTITYELSWTLYSKLFRLKFSPYTNSIYFSYNANCNRGSPGNRGSLPRYGRKPCIRKPYIRKPYIRKPYVRKPYIRKPYIRKPYAMAES